MTITRACCALALLVTTACAGFVLWAAYGFDREYATWAAVLDGAVVSLGALLLTGVGVLIVLRGQGHVIGRVQVLSGLGMITNVAGYSAQTLYLEGMRPPWTQWVAWLGSWTWTFMPLGVWLTLVLGTERSARGASIGTERSAGGASIGTERSARGPSHDTVPDRDFEADLLPVLDRTVAPTTAWLWQPERAVR